MDRNKRPRRRLRSWLRVEPDRIISGPRRRSLARRDQEPQFDPAEEIEYQWAARVPEEYIDQYGVRQGGRDGYGWKRLGGY